jgi:hypothetical protein
MKPTLSIFELLLIHTVRFTGKLYELAEVDHFKAGSNRNRGVRPRTSHVSTRHTASSSMRQFYLTVDTPWTYVSLCANMV